MEQKQFLTNEQINAILNVVMRDSVNNQVEDAIKAELGSDEFKIKLEEIKNSKETLDQIESENTSYQNNLKAFDLFQQIKAIDEDFVKQTNWDDEISNISWLVGTTLEYIELNHKNYLESINNSCESKTRSELKINSHYTIKDSVREDLKARLLLITPSNYDAVVTDIVKYINISKYLRYS